MEPKFWNLSDWNQMLSGKEELWNTELCLSIVESDKNSEGNICETDKEERQIVQYYWKINKQMRRQDSFITEDI